MFAEVDDMMSFEVVTSEPYKILVDVYGDERLKIFSKHRSEYFHIHIVKGYGAVGARRRGIFHLFRKDSYICHSPRWWESACLKYVISIVSQGFSQGVSKDLTEFWEVKNWALALLKNLIVESMSCLVIGLSKTALYSFDRTGKDG